jgi:tetratricopeptide (TPR) repeat protein
MITAMMSSLKLHHMFLAVVCGLGMAAGTLAQNPTMTSGYNDSEKEALYARFNDYKRNPDPTQQKFAYPVAKDYLRRWGGETDPETKEVRRFVVEYERQMHGRELFAAYEAKDYAKVFEVGRPATKSDPDNFVALSLMVEAGYDSAVAGKTGFVSEASEYAREAIKLLETGKVTKPDPFKNMDVARGFLNFTLGWFVKDDRPVEAAAAFEKAVKADGPYRTDPSAYLRLGAAILKGEFAQLSTQYNEKFGGKPSSPEQTAMLNRIQHLVEQTIDAYARAVALNTKPEQQEARTKILGQLTALYKNFHNNSDAGLNELIATVLSKPIP